MQANFIYALLSIILCISPVVLTYQIPNVKVELLSEGFRVSIPHEEGIKIVAYNINRNRRFRTFSQGEISEQVHEPVNNEWTLESKRKLGQDDVLHIWLNVQYQQYVYRRKYDDIPVNALTYAKDVPVANTPTVAPVTIKTTTPLLDVREQCVATKTITQQRNVCRGSLIFEENFDTAFDESRWKQEVLLPLDTSDDEFVVYDTLATVSGGFLNIVPKLWNPEKPSADIRQQELNLGSRCTAKINPAMECRRVRNQFVHSIVPPVTSARINTRDSFTFQYGRVEIRAKIPQGDWLYPLFLLEPVEHHYGNTAYDSGQIRIAFARGNLNFVTKDGKNLDGSHLFGGAVLSLNATLRQKSMVQTSGSEHFGNQFHIYSLTWNDKEMIFKVDDREYGTITGPFESENLELSNLWKKGGTVAPFDRQFFLTLGVAVGGHGDFPDDTLSNNHEKPWENTGPKATYEFWTAREDWKPTWTNPGLQVDYVRVYAV